MADTPEDPVHSSQESGGLSVLSSPHTSGEEASLSSLYSPHHHTPTQPKVFRVSGWELFEILQMKCVTWPIIGKCSWFICFSLTSHKFSI